MTGLKKITEKFLQIFLSEKVSVDMDSLERAYYNVPILKRKYYTFTGHVLLYYWEISTFISELFWVAWIKFWIYLYRETNSEWTIEYGSRVYYALKNKYKLTK